MFFVLNTGRAGSRTIANVLSQHPELICSHEPVPRLIEETVAYRYGQLPAEELSETLAATRPTSIDGRRYGESANRLSLGVPVLAETFPDAQFIWLLRDGTEVVSSGMQRGWFDPERITDTPWERGRMRGDELGEIDPDVWAAWTPFRRISWLWRRTNEIIEHDLAALAPERHMAVRLEDLESTLPAIAEFLDVPDINWVIPRLNARALVPDTGPGSANEVSRVFSVADWTDEQHDEFKEEAGAFQQAWYPQTLQGDQDGAADQSDQGDQPNDESDGPLEHIQVDLADLKSLRSELNIVNAHSIRNDRRLTEVRAQNLRLQERLDTSWKNRNEERKAASKVERKLAVAEQKIEHGKVLAAAQLADERTAQRNQRKATERGDRLNELLKQSKATNKKHEQRIRALNDELRAIRSTESYRLGHGLVRVGKLPMKALRRGTKAGSPAAPAKKTTAPRQLSATTKAPSTNQHLRGATDLDRLDPAAIDDGALASLSMTLPTGASHVTAIDDALRTLDRDGVALFTIPIDAELDLIEASLTHLAGTRAVSLVQDDGLLIAEVTSGTTKVGLIQQLVHLAREGTRDLATAKRRATDLGRKAEREEAARKRQAAEFRDTTQYRLGAALLDVAHRPTKVVQLVKEVRELQQRRKTDPEAPAVASTDIVPRLDLNVVSILDEFTHDCFAPEFNLIPLDRKGWSGQISSADLLFVESAWRGNGGTWNYTINRFDERGDDLKAVLAAAKQHSVPTVFWNKEDPVSFDVFLPTAKAFDGIFTTDADVVDAYKEAAQHDRVDAMPFAAQPALHNPIGRPRGGDVLNRVCFAGSWRGDKYAKRGSDFDTLLRPALSRGALDIYDRYAGGPDEDRLGFPEPFKSSVLGSLPYSEIGTAYRSYAAFLNVNSVQESPTMFSRRVFELLACGTPVISTPATGIERLLGDTVLTTDTPERTAELVDWVINEPLERDRHAHRGYRLVHSKHSYEHRVDQLLGLAGVAAKRPRRRVTVICVSNRPEMLDHAIQSFERQTYPDKEFIFVANSAGFDTSMLNSVAARVQNAQAYQIDESATLGECLNHALAGSDGDYFAKFDDDDHYGENYLSDLMITFPYSGAAVAGKQSYYAYMSRLDRTVLRFPGKEFRKAPRVVGGTIVADRSLVDGIEFQAVKRGTDSHFLEAVQARGLKIFSADRFNFCQVRHVDPNQHTWGIDEEEFLRACEPVGSGFCESEIFV